MGRGWEGEVVDCRFILDFLRREIWILRQRVVILAGKIIRFRPEEMEGRKRVDIHLNVLETRLSFEI